MFRNNRGWCRGRVCGMVLMLTGLVLMMIIVPRWAWAGIICLATIMIGFILWRFC